MDTIETIFGDIHVHASSVGKRPGDDGKRWFIHCEMCGWNRHVKWKGGHRIAVNAALEHATTCDNGLGP